MWMLRTKPGSSARVASALTTGPYQSCQSKKKFFFFFGSEPMLLQSYTGQIDPGGHFTTDRSEVEDEI